MSVDGVSSHLRAVNRPPREDCVDCAALLPKAASKGGAAARRRQGKRRASEAAEGGGEEAEGWVEPAVLKQLHAAYCLEPTFYCWRAHEAPAASPGEESPSPLASAAARVGPPLLFAARLHSANDLVLETPPSLLRPPPRRAARKEGWVCERRLFTPSSCEQASSSSCCSAAARLAARLRRECEMRLFTPPRRAQALHAAGATGGGGTSTRGFPCGWGRSPSTRSSLFLTTCWSITHYSLRLQASKRGWLGRRRGKAL